MRINNWKKFNEEFTQSNINNVISDIQSKGYETIKVENENEAIDKASQIKEDEKKAFIGTQKIEGGFYYFVAMKNTMGQENRKALEEVAKESSDKTAIGNYSKGSVVMLKIH
jgi:hypothetical protein